jgi:autotransporter-associated beta strand protein
LPAGSTPNLITLTLDSSGVQAINSAKGGYFSFGAALTSITGSANQYIFGASGSTLQTLTVTTSSEYVWISSNPGSIGEPSNWSSNTVPNAIDVIATISTQPTNTGDFTLNDSITLGTLNYSNNQNRVISGSGSIQFQVSSGNALVNVPNGSGALALTIPTVAMQSSTEFRINNTDDVTIYSQVTGANELIKTGSGTLSLRGSNSYTGATRINAGTLSGNSIANTGNGSAFGSGNLITVGNGATLQYTGSTASTNRAVSLGGGSTVDVTQQTTLLTLTGQVFDVGGLTKIGLGELRLDNTSNSYQGATNISGGTLRLGAAGVIPDNSAVTITNARLNMNGFDETIGSLASGNSNSQVSLNGGKLTVGANNASTTFSGIIDDDTGNRGIAKIGTGTLTLTGANQYTGTTEITGGTISGNSIANQGSDSAFGQGNFSISNGATLRYTGPVASTDRTFSLGAGDATIWVDNNSTTQTDLVVFGTVSGNGGLIKQGAGELVLHHTDNAYAGLNDLRQGSLQGRTLTNAGSTSSFGRGNFQLSGGAELYYYGGTTTTDRTATLNTGGGTITVANPTATIVWTGVISGIGGLTKAGTGNLQLETSNTYSGATVIDNGQLRLGANERLPDSTAVTINSNGTLNMFSATETIGSLAGSGSVINNGQLITGGNNTSTMYSGVISGTGNVVKQGGGLMTLTGGNSYSGSTLINGGTLVVNNSTGSATGTGAVAVNSGGTLAGSGRVTGHVIVNGGGTLAPGNSIESLDVGSLSFNPGGSTFDVELDTNASLTAAADLVNANGNLGIFAGAILALADLGNTLLADGVKFTLISYAGAWNGGTFDGYADDSLVTVGVNTYRLNYNDTSSGQNFGGGAYANKVTLTAANTTAVPEASSFIFGGIVCLAVAGAHFGRKYFQRRHP